MRAWTIRIAQEYVGWFDTADEALAEVKRLHDREEKGLTLIEGHGFAGPNTDEPPNREAK